MIDERMEEQASLYVLGALDAEETRTFELALRNDPELQRLVAALRSASDALAGNAAPLTPPPALKQKILAEIDRRQKIVPLTSPTAEPASSNWFPWALAACLAAVCGLLVVSHSNRVADLQSQVASANHKAADQDKEFKTELAELNETVSRLQATNKDLHIVVAELQHRNDLANLRIAVLDSLVPESKAVAVTLWNNDRQDGILVVQKLGEPPPDKDYQLWVIDPGEATPIDAGVFKVDASGTLRAPFTAHSRVKTPGKFAVTVERKGGSPKPQGKIVMVGS